MTNHFVIKMNSNEVVLGVLDNINLALLLDNKFFTLQDPLSIATSTKDNKNYLKYMKWESATGAFVNGANVCSVEHMSVDTVKQYDAIINPSDDDKTSSKEDKEDKEDKEFLDALRNSSETIH